MGTHRPAGRGGTAALVAAVLVVLACVGGEVPFDKSAYLGRWVGEDRILEIAGDGHIEYVRVSGETRVEIAGYIRAFDGDDFLVGLPLFSTRFEVSDPPAERGGRWVIVVDGVELTRVGVPEEEFSI